eukprot:376596_1
MDADPLSLLVILRQELQDIANGLQPQPDIIEDILTDNGLNNNQENENPNSSASLSEHEQDEDEKAGELPSDIKHTIQTDTNSNLGGKLDQLIQNYLTPTIKQLSKKKRKKNKKRANLSNYYESTADTAHLSQSHSPSAFYHTQSPPQTHNTNPAQPSAAFNIS